MAQQKKCVTNNFSSPHQLWRVVLELTSTITVSYYFSAFSWITAFLFGIYNNDSQNKSINKTSHCQEYHNPLSGEETTLVSRDTGTE